MADQNLALEHKVIQPLRAFSGGDWLLAVSGGVDSLVLAEILYRWSRLLKIRLHVAHVHHGRSATKKQTDYRDKAQKLVGDWCEKRRVTYLTNLPESLRLGSEAELREYRQSHLQVWAESLAAKFIVYAHHRDDLLETRMQRLIRGTGAAGLRGMVLRRGKKLRPLLECARIEIEDYARSREINFSSDPSNKDLGPLRNWLRHEWLPALEKKRPGASAALARSLEILSEPTVVESKPNVGLRRELLGACSPLKKEKVIADYLRGLGLKNYSRSHVREILKRIDSPQKNPTFRMLGVVFQVTPDLFWATQV